MTELLVCSNRGPYNYRRADGGFVGRRGGGGLIGAVAPVMERFGGTWVAAALSPEDRELARSEPDGREEDGFRLRLLDVPQELHELHYNVVSNEYLWFLFHYLFDVASEPSFGSTFSRAWDAYREVNRIYADALREVGGEAVLVEDYHLLLVAEELRRRGERRPICYFHHTPWCEPGYFSVLPRALVEEILAGMLAYDGVAFHARRWLRAFRACCEELLPGARVSEDRIEWNGRSTALSVAPVPLDAPRLAEEAASERTERWLEWVQETRRDRTLLVRVDRMDLSKNSLRGFLAFEALLERRPELATEVVFLALQYPSRLTVARYRRYFAECLEAVERVNERFGRHAPGEEGPLSLHFQDEFSRSLAGMRAYDALLVNSVYDGLNLVAKEGAAVNERDGVLILSRNTGVFEEIGEAVEPVNPFDVLETAAAIERAVEMPGAERHEKAERLRELATRTTPEGWARARLEAAGVSVPQQP